MQRINEAFKDAATEDVEKYQALLFDSWQNISKSLNKIVVLIFVLAAASELLIYQPASKLAIGSFTFTNTSSVQILIPAIVTYIVYDGYLLTMRWVDHKNAYIAITKEFTPKIYENDLDLLIRPPLPALWNIGSTSQATIALTSEKFAAGTTRFFGIIAIFIFPLTFEIQIYDHLFTKYGIHDLLLWVSVSITAALMVSAFINLVLWSLEDW